MHRSWSQIEKTEEREDTMEKITRFRDIPQFTQDGAWQVDFPFDYLVKYIWNVNAGSATVVIVGNGKYEDSIVANNVKVNYSKYDVEFKYDKEKQRYDRYINIYQELGGKI